MAVPSFSDTLYDCATECALRRRSGKCKANYGWACCDDCTFNVAQYGNYSPEQVKLFMLSANSRAASLCSSDNSHRIVSIALILFFLSAAWTTNKGQLRWEETHGPIEIGRIVIGQPQSQVPVQPAATTHETIQRTLNTVADAIRARTDVNGDRLINCIDAAVLFYKYYPYKDKVTISVNKNDATDMHHLFNVVLVNDVWRAVEPQAAFAGHRSYWMRDVWGSKYDSSLNRVVTNDYLRFVK